MLEQKYIEAYNASRSIPGKYLCHAPFTNMYFNTRGQAAACWLTFTDPPRYPENSIHEIWFGSYFQRLRRNIEAHDLSETCKVCEKNIEQGLNGNALARAYDVPHALGKYPRVMEFELSNRCNLECVMCNGRLSSSIRKNREKMPEYASHYDEKFTEQLEEFIPHLKETRFYGGEPFLQEECWAIWDRIVSMNPAIEITVATNATVWSKRVEDILGRGNFRINVSIDGMSPETYETIRKNARFVKVIANARKFADYCDAKKSNFCIMYNPMRSNWHELPKLIEFCNENNYQLEFNTIYRPFHLAIWTMKADEISHIRQTLSSRVIMAEPGQVRAVRNCEIYANFVDNQLRVWEEEQRVRESTSNDYASKIKSRENAKLIFSESLTGHVGANKVSLLQPKLDRLEKLAMTNITSNDFYHHLNERPLDWVLSDLENRSDEDFIEIIFYAAKYY